MRSTKNRAWNPSPNANNLTMREGATFPHGQVVSTLSLGFPHATMKYKVLSEWNSTTATCDYVTLPKVRNTKPSITKEQSFSAQHNSIKFQTRRLSSIIDQVFRTNSLRTAKKVLKRLCNPQINHW